jgi:hypothetical protein
MDSILARYAVASVYDVADEILIYRDGPQDDRYWPRFLRFIADRPKVRVIEGKVNLGYVCRNVLIREASHTVLHFMDSDALLNDHYRDQFAEAVHFTEAKQGITCLPSQNLHGDTAHVRQECFQVTDTCESLAYYAESLRWENEVSEQNPDGFENLFGARVFLYPLRIEVPNSYTMDHEYADQLHDPIIVDLSGVKDNRLLSYRAVALDYQRERPGYSIDEYVMRRAAQANITPAQIYEQMAVERLNSWGPGAVRTERFGKLPSVVTDRLGNVVTCTWSQDGYVVHRDDSGWSPELH